MNAFLQQQGKREIGQTEGQDKHFFPKMFLFVFVDNFAQKSTL
jgi:hypothetical protein